jgi:hypothetical protein
MFRQKPHDVSHSVMVRIGWHRPIHAHHHSIVRRNAIAGLWQIRGRARRSIARPFSLVGGEQLGIGSDLADLGSEQGHQPLPEPVTGRPPGPRDRLQRFGHPRQPALDQGVEQFSLVGEVAIHAGVALPQLAGDVTTLVLPGPWPRITTSAASMIRWRWASVVSIERLRAMRIPGEAMGLVAVSR